MSQNTIDNSLSNHEEDKKTILVSKTPITPITPITPKTIKNFTSNKTS